MGNYRVTNDILIWQIGSLLSREDYRGWRTRAKILSSLGGPLLKIPKCNKEMVNDFRTFLQSNTNDEFAKHSAMYRMLTSLVCISEAICFFRFICVILRNYVSAKLYTKCLYRELGRVKSYKLWTWALNVWRVPQILNLTYYVQRRLAFSTVNFIFLIRVGSASSSR